jgi:hypothetical protein
MQIGLHINMSSLRVFPKSDRLAKRPLECVVPTVGACDA